MASLNHNISINILLQKLDDSAQKYKILAHLIKRGGISQLEARNTYRVERLASRVSELRKLGAPIKSERKLDESGHRYMRYRLVDVG